MNRERAFNLQSTEESYDLVDNGLILNDIYVPIELIQRIMYCVDEKTLLNCQLVCKQWNETIIDYVWRKKAEIKTGHKFSSDTALEWKDFYLICVNNLFGRNLLKNPSGADGLKYWKFITDHFFVHEDEQEFLSDNSSDSNSSDENESSNDNMSESSDEISDNDTERHSISSIESDFGDVVVMDENSENHNDSYSDSNNEQEINEYFSSDESSSDINTNSDNDSVGDIGNLDVNHFGVYDESAHDWIIECPPVCAPLPPTKPEFEDKTHCFVTTHFNCYKEQVIDLFKEGFSVNILDKMQPTIEINEWYCSREDCPALYKLRVLLLNEFDKILKEFAFKDILEGRRQNTWFNVKHEFKNYGKGLRKIRFVDGGSDRMYRAGHYGPKMGGAYIKVNISNRS